MSAQDILPVQTHKHKPVLIGEVIKYLSPEVGKIYVDGTFGRGGYTREILKLGGRVYGIDCDPEACRVGRTIELAYPGRFTMIHGRFADMKDHLIREGQGKVDGIVLDLGVSSPQLDEADRGFSFQRDGPLDMRMSQSGLSAADLVNTLSADDLADIIYRYGEERLSRRIAAKIIEKRVIKPIETTFELADLVRSVVPKERAGFDPATRTFQALRIKVNDELGQLEGILRDSEELLKDGGRLVIVSFHSLEDRIVKMFFRDKSGASQGVNRHMPVTSMPSKTPVFKLLTKKAVKATQLEMSQNPRSRSAVLRAVMKCLPKVEELS